MIASMSPIMAPTPSRKTLRAALSMAKWKAQWKAQWKANWQGLREWPWLDTLRTLRVRFREDHLSLTASSLTFTTLIALVPLLTVMLAVFSAFPMFASFEGALEKYFLQALVPDSIAKPVLRALTQFAAKASRMGTLGLTLFVATALAMVFTMDRTLNAIWRVPKPRPWGQRVLVYWAALTLGPLMLGVSLTMTSYALTAGSGIVAAMPGGLHLLLACIEFLLLACAMAGLFHYVPNTFVRWRHAWAGALFTAAGLEAAKSCLTWYVQSVPTFSAVYGAFATVPILLLWIYLAWVIVLLGAVVAAYAPSLRAGLKAEDSRAGSRFTLALAVVRALRTARGTARAGLDGAELSVQLGRDPLLVESMVEQLVQLGWVGRLDEAGAQRFVLLCDPAHAPLAPLVDIYLLDHDTSSMAFRHAAGLERMSLAEALGD